MAKDSSFDIVSQIDLQEVDNAFGQAKKELSQRYDLKDSGSEILFDKASKTVTIKAPSDFVVGQVMDIFTSKLVKRGIDLNSLSWGKPENATGGTVRKVGTLIEGIDRETAGKINKDIKTSKLKVKVAIEGDKLRVSGPKLDTLQEVIALVKGNDYGQPLQFVNYR
jgi:cyclic-di-GMP-binding protein